MAQRVVDRTHRRAGNHEGDHQEDDLQQVAQFHVVAEDQVHGFENDELGEEQDREGREHPEDTEQGSRSGLEEGRHPVFETDDHVQQSLQQDRCEDRDRERVDHDVIHVLHKQVQHHDIDEDVGHP